MNCDIRLATPDDIGDIVAIGRSTFAKAYGDIVLTSDMESYLAKFFDPELLQSEITSRSASYFVAESEQDVVGYAKLAETERPDQLADEKVAELIRLYVSPGHYGMGIGSGLLKAVKLQALAAGFKGVWLRVWEKNSGAIRLYERDGFKRLGIEPYFIGITANPVVLMFEELTIGEGSLLIQGKGGEGGDAGGD